MAFIIIIAFIIYFILIAWTWQSLGFIEKNKKIIFILIGIILIYIVTLIVFQMTKGEIIYEDKRMQRDIQNILVAIFTGINGIIIMPQIAKMIDNAKEKQAEKEKIIKRIIVLIIIFVISLIFERGYMKNIQEGILKIYHSMK